MTESTDVSPRAATWAAAVSRCGLRLTERGRGAYRFPPARGRLATFTELGGNIVGLFAHGGLWIQGLPGPRSCPDYAGRYGEGSADSSDVGEVLTAVGGASRGDTWSS